MISVKTFKSANGAQETFTVITFPSGMPFRKALTKLNKDYSQILKKAVFSRIFLSDIANQHSLLTNLPKHCSVIEQRPIDDSPLTLLVYNLKPESLKNYRLIYSTNLTSLNPFNSFSQTKKIFSNYTSLLKATNLTLRNNVVRTWIYVRDIDNHYAGMVKSRREFFAENGLNPKTRFIASTGIEARLREPGNLVSMDALAIERLNPKQIIRMEAPKYLNPTHEYGVTFERGSKIVFGDRSHLYVSGTASINNKGEILFPFNVEKQTRRAIINVQALLKPHGAKLTDMMYLIIYLRNVADKERVKKIIEAKFPKTPLVFVEGAVCRPNWLVEIEGEAIIPAKTHWPLFR